ncbi:uncharacterized protein LOC103168108 [Ornithorhynchus anatinus]|uniref:uncharacterized protein LOC103168108 n=1 Tax=Ornithorhynchus anatinus TaxID=9258 RepID=UPI0010A8AC60|nr:uncharacterized protein LOC103168108 [Ornithorhynchus anatinus]
MVLGFTLSASVNGSRCAAFLIRQGDVEVVRSEMLLTRLADSLSETLPLPLEAGDLLNSLLSASISEKAGDSFQSLVDPINACDSAATEGRPLSYSLLEVKFTEACFLSVYCTKVTYGRTALAVPAGPAALPGRRAGLVAVLAPTVIGTMLSCVVSASSLKRNDYTLVIRNTSLAFPAKNTAILTYATSVRGSGRSPVTVTTVLEIAYNTVVSSSTLETALRMNRATHSAEDPDVLAALIPWCEEQSKKVFGNVRAMFSRVNLPPAPVLGSFAGGSAEPDKDGAVVVTCLN